MDLPAAHVFGRVFHVVVVDLTRAAVVAAVSV